MRVLTLLGLFFCLPLFSADSLDTRIDRAYREMEAENEAALLIPASPGDQTLSILNVNLGLLTGKIAYVPAYQARSRVFAKTLAEFIREKKVDLLFLQELWLEDDFKAVLKMAAQEGFLPVLSESDYFAKVAKYGMQILVRKEALRPETQATGVEIRDFSRTTLPEYWGGYKRAILSASVTLANGRGVRLANAHLSATIGANAIRQLQVAELSSELKKTTESNSLVIFGADFNVSPEFEDALPSEVKAWGENRAPYVEFYEATHLVEAFKTLHRQEPGYTWDKRNNTLISDGPSAIKKEPLQRTDFIWIGKPSTKTLSRTCAVELAELVFTEATISEGSKKVHLTDHFGNFARVRILAR